MRLAGFASSAFATWAPKTFAYYAGHLCDHLLHNAQLVLNWMNSVFAATTFNFGPRTLCFRHMDSVNLLFSCHLVLWDLKLVIDFLPGSTILIPSAILRHSNTTIAKGEFQTSEEYWRSLHEEEHLQAQKECSERWMMGLHMFSTLEELPHSFCKGIDSMLGLTFSTTAIWSLLL
ncbi:hypothetical protein ARMGADRAFT_1048379 [Armillaria gallica]|uniref:Uncharacterized protein n=1 Tax=Armillaria gallica TaxID=47427 RepID=A0A2H3D888_ARMGA|nr:hypothetical protein ARMGADRAFT_1048379 [Armillaria gallica]